MISVSVVMAAPAYVFFLDKTAVICIPHGIYIRKWLVLEIDSESVHLCQNFLTVTQSGGSQSGLGSSVAGSGLSVG